VLKKENTKVGIAVRLANSGERKRLQPAARASTTMTATMASSGCQRGESECKRGQQPRQGGRRARVLR